MDSFFQLHRASYPLNGLDRTYTVLHISDVHLSEYDSASTSAERNAALQANRHWEKLRLQFGEQFGESLGKNHLVTLTGYFERFIRLSNELKPDAVVITGDLMDSYSDANFRYLVKMLPNFKSPLLLVQGNHETGDLPAWHHLYGEHPDFQTLRVGKLKLIALNNSCHTVSAEALKDLQLELARQDDTAPVLCTHIPFCTADCAAYWDTLEPYFSIRQDNCDESTAAFFRYFLSPDCPLTLNLCGHIHGRSETMLVPGKTQMTASSACLGSCTLLTLTPFAVKE